MSRNRLVGLIAAAVVLIAVIVGGIYAYQRKAAPPAPGEPAPVAEQKQQPGTPAPAPAPAPQSEAKKTEAPKPTAVPSFDVVRIEQSGEGVIAGRAEAGWTVKLESGGTKVAETIVDEEGAWMVVLEKALPAGSHTLTLRAISPDGTKALTAQQGVQVAVGPAPSEPQMAGEEAPPESGGASPAATPPAEPPAAEKAPDVAAPEPEIAPEAVPAPPIPPSERPKPPVRIKKVDYVDVGSDSGKITMSGIGDPGGTIVFFFDDARVGEAVIGSDGTWSQEVEKRLVGDGDHILRVDKINPDSPMPAGRASVTLRRAPEAAAKQEPAPSAPAPEPMPPAASAPAADQPKSEQASKDETVETAAREGTPAPVAGAPVDLSRQPQPVYPSADSDGADTYGVGRDIAAAPGAAEKTQIAPTESAKAERDAPVLPLQPVYPSGSSPASERPSFPVVTGKPVDLSSQPQPLYPGRTGEEAPQVSAAAEPAASVPAVTERQSTPAAPSPSIATPPATGSAPAAESSMEKTTSEPSPKQAASAETPSLESQPQPVVPKEEPAPQVAASEPPPSDPAVTVEEPSASPTLPPPVAAPAPSGATANGEPPSLASQPQPVVPKEEPAPQVAASEPAPSDPAVTVEEPSASPTPPPSVAAPAPSGATANAEPPSVASQPQPVTPKEQPQPEAKPESSAPVAAAMPPKAPAPSEPASPPASEQTTERAKTPEVAAAPPTVTAETPGTKKPEAELPKVVFNSVDYAEAEGETGSVALTGTGEPGARIHLFLNNHPLGETTVADDGSWSFEASRKLHPGQHNIRADQLEAGGTVVASASIGMERMETPVPPEEPVAAQQPPAAPPPATPSPMAKETETAAAEADKPAADESKPRRVRSRNYTVQKGDTLWDIAEDFYGGGWRFRAIVRGNRNKIQNPHWIYPDQQFRMPDKP
jgi:nucleoid-associated protein YgaU